MRRYVHIHVEGLSGGGGTSCGDDVLNSAELTTCFTNPTEPRACAVARFY
jgi:hypothetical protein